MDQGEAEEGAAALILIVPAHGDIDRLRLGRVPGGGRLRALQKIVQGDAEIGADGHQVIHIGLGCAGFPLLDRLAGDTHDIGQLLLGDAPLLAEPVEPLLKHRWFLLCWDVYSIAPEVGKGPPRTLYILTTGGCAGLL